MEQTSLVVRSGRIPSPLRQKINDFTDVRVGKNRLWFYADEISAIRKCVPHQITSEDVGLILKYIYPGDRIMDNLNHQVLSLNTKVPHVPPVLEDHQIGAWYSFIFSEETSISSVLTQLIHYVYYVFETQARYFAGTEWDFLRELDIPKIIKGIDEIVKWINLLRDILLKMLTLLRNLSMRSMDLQYGPVEEVEDVPVEKIRWYRKYSIPRLFSEYTKAAKHVKKSLTRKPNIIAVNPTRIVALRAAVDITNDVNDNEPTPLGWNPITDCVGAVLKVVDFVMDYKHREADRRKADEDRTRQREAEEEARIRELERLEVLNQFKKITAATVEFYASITVMKPYLQTLEDRTLLIPAYLKTKQIRKLWNETAHEFLHLDVDIPFEMQAKIMDTSRDISAQFSLGFFTTKQHMVLFGHGSGLNYWDEIEDMHPKLTSCSMQVTEMQPKLTSVIEQVSQLATCSARINEMRPQLTTVMGQVAQVQSLCDSLARSVNHVQSRVDTLCSNPTFVSLTRISYPRIQLQQGGVFPTLITPHGTLYCIGRTDFNSNVRFPDLVGTSLRLYRCLSSSLAQFPLYALLTTSSDQIGWLTKNFRLCNNLAELQAYVNNATGRIQLGHDVVKDTEMEEPQEGVPEGA